MIRFATPVTDIHGNKKGIIILNYLAEKMINSLAEKTEMSRGEKMILNSDGFWLHCRTEENEWGFMLEDRNSKNFQLFILMNGRKSVNLKSLNFRLKTDYLQLKLFIRAQIMKHHG